MLSENEAYLNKLQGSLQRLVAMGASPLYIQAVQKRIYEVQALIRDEKAGLTDVPIQ